MKHIINIIKGIAVGAATLVPGVSGGTMAIILGVYDNLIHSISSFFENWKKHLMLLLEIGLGVIIGAILLSGLMGSALKNYPRIMGFLFMGIIIGGLPVLYRKSITSGERNIKDFFFFILGFVIVLLLSKEDASTAAMATSQGLLSVVFLFFAGIVLAIALILPGISGSYMLLILGMLDITYSAIKTLNIPYLIPLGLGVAFGTLATTKIIEKFLQQYPQKTYMLILGFVIGSLIPVFPGIPPVSEAISCILALCIGFTVILYLGKKGFTAD